MGRTQLSVIITHAHTISNCQSGAVHPGPTHPDPVTNRIIQDIDDKLAQTQAQLAAVQKSYPIGDNMKMLPVESPDLEIRELTSEEISTVEAVFTERGHSLPHPAQSTFVGAVQNGKVLGFLVLQVKLHAEPMWIADGHSDLFMSIAHEAEKIVLSRVGPCWVYLFSPAGKIAQLAQSMGMQMEPYVIMSKLVTPEAPPKPVVSLDLPLEEVSVDGGVQ